MRLRQWVPMFLVICTLIGAWIGYDETSGARSWGWAIAGLAVGLLIVVFIVATGRSDRDVNNR